MCKKRLLWSKMKWKMRYTINIEWLVSTRLTTFKETTLMALYMFQGTYTPEAWASMTKNPQDRSVGLSELIQKLGGKLINMYYCFGDYDVIAILRSR